jgi:hypothetical protein
MINKATEAIVLLNTLLLLSVTVNHRTSSSFRVWNKMKVEGNSKPLKAAKSSAAAR